MKVMMSRPIVEPKHDPETERITALMNKHDGLWYMALSNGDIRITQDHEGTVRFVGSLTVEQAKRLLRARGVQV